MNQPGGEPHFPTAASLPQGAVRRGPKRVEAGGAPAGPGVKRGECVSAVDGMFVERMNGRIFDFDVLLQETPTLLESRHFKSMSSRESQRLG